MRRIWDETISTGHPWETPGDCHKCLSCVPGTNKEPTSLFRKRWGPLRGIPLRFYDVTCFLNVTSCLRIQYLINMKRLLTELHEAVCIVIYSIDITWVHVSIYCGVYESVFTSMCFDSFLLRNNCSTQLHFNPLSPWWHVNWNGVLWLTDVTMGMVLA